MSMFDDAEIERILAMSEPELNALLVADGRNPEDVVARFREIEARVLALCDVCFGRRKVRLQRWTTHDDGSRTTEDYEGRCCRCRGTGRRAVTP